MAFSIVSFPGNGAVVDPRKRTTSGSTMQDVTKMPVVSRN